MKQPRFTIKEIAAYIAGWTTGQFGKVKDVAKATLLNALSQLECDQDGIEAFTRSSQGVSKSKEESTEYNAWICDLAVGDMVDSCHRLAVASGWWNDPLSGDPIDPHTKVAEKLLLIHSEVSEATEGFRKGIKDDHLSHRDMFDVELADALIRICDLAGAMRIDLAGAVRDKLIYNSKRADHKPENRVKDGGKKF